MNSNPSINPKRQSKSIGEGWQDLMLDTSGVKEEEGACLGVDIREGGLLAVFWTEEPELALVSGCPPWVEVQDEGEVTGEGVAAEGVDVEVAHVEAPGAEAGQLDLAGSWGRGEEPPVKVVSDLLQRRAQRLQQQRGRRQLLGDPGLCHALEPQDAVAPDRGRHAAALSTHSAFRGLGC